MSTSTANAVEIDPVAKFKSSRGYGISPQKIAAAATQNIENVRKISVPAYVRERTHGDSRVEVPLLSEMGGPKCDFAIVPGGKGGSPVPWNEIFQLFSNGDQTIIRYGSAIVSPGSTFGLSYSHYNDSTILLYRVDEVSEYTSANDDSGEEDTDSKNKKLNIARLDCTLIGYAMRDWRSPRIHVPDEYMGLYHAVKKRATVTDLAPVNMEVWRMQKRDEALAKIFDTVEVTEVKTPLDEDVRDEIMREVIKIRTDVLESAGDNKKAARAKINGRSILTLADNAKSIELELRIYNHVYNTLVEFKIDITAENYNDTVTQYPIVERNMLCATNSFANLVSDLTKRNGQITTMLACIR